MLNNFILWSQLLAVFRELLTYLLTYLFTCLLTPWCRVILEKLTGLQLVKKFPALHGTRRFITALTSVRHLSLSWASPIQVFREYINVFMRADFMSTYLAGVLHVKLKLNYLNH